MAASKAPLVRLHHIRDEMMQLTSALDGVTFESFAKDYVLRRATEHAILIISEAIKALSPAFTDHHPGVDWRAVRDIGNLLRHEYFEVDIRVLWRIANDRLPELKPVIERMIGDQTS